MKKFIQLQNFKNVIGNLKVNDLIDFIENEKTFKIGLNSKIQILLLEKNEIEEIKNKNDLIIEFEKFKKFVENENKKLDVEFINFENINILENLAE